MLVLVREVYICYVINIVLTSCANWDLNGVKQSVFLHYGLSAALARCDLKKIRLQYQTNEHVQLPFPEYGPQNENGIDETCISQLL